MGILICWHSKRYELKHQLSNHSWTTRVELIQASMEIMELERDWQLLEVENTGRHTNQYILLRTLVGQYYEIEY